MRKKGICFVLGIAALLVVAYMIPTIVTLVQDSTLKKEIRQYTMETVEINTGESDFYNLLQGFPYMLANNAMYVETGKNLTKDQVHQLEEAFLEEISIEIDYERLKYRQEQACLYTDFQYEMVYFVWECLLVDEYERPYQLWIDDATGKVLGFVILNTLIEEMDMATEVFFADRLAEYYDFAAGKLAYHEEYGLYTISFYDQEEKEQIVLSITLIDERVIFNLTGLPDYTDEQVLVDDPGRMAVN